MRRLIILHTNDIHGRVEGLARVATLVERVRAERAGVPVVYVDCGDSEESSVPISGVTKGAAMHELLSVAGCAAAAVGNAGIGRYGPQVLPEHAGTAAYPLLLANLRTAEGGTLPGAQPTAILPLGDLRLGLIGLTSLMWGVYERDFGMRAEEFGALTRELSAALRREGADAVVVLSHMGLKWDRALAEAAPDLSLILGAHTHDLLPEGERVGEVVICQVGSYAEHLGRVDLTWDGERLRVERASVLPVGADAPPSPAVLAAASRAEAGARRSCGR